MNEASQHDQQEISRFNSLAERWWDEAGPFRPLHQFNPTRIAAIKQLICQHYAIDETIASPLKRLTLLDLGCGGGLVAEPMARLGATVSGIDAAADSIRVAKNHSEMMRLSIDYHSGDWRELITAARRFQVVLALEIIEHVDEPHALLADCRQLLAEGGLLIVSTLNRTPESFIKAIVGAEYILRWLPIGTHDWRKFVRPSELAQGLRQAGLKPLQFMGFSYHPLWRNWKTSNDLGVNYLVAASHD